jgi:hypothetical protein
VPVFTVIFAEGRRAHRAPAALADAFHVILRHVAGFVAMVDQ